MFFPDVITVIERTAPLHIAASWDHSGLQVPAAHREISSLAVCLDPVPATIAAALEHGADMILSHHPLAMSPRFTDREDSYTAALRQLFKADVPLYAAHTSLDANPRGPSGWLARALSMQDACVLEPTGSIENADGTTLECGFGLLGTLPEPLELEKALEIINPQAPRLIGVKPEDVHPLCVAICPGSGGSLAALAAQGGAELFITGDIKYHDALLMPLPVLDVGHFSLEEHMMRLFAQQLQEELPDIAVSFIPSEDPFRLCQRS